MQQLYLISISAVAYNPPGWRLLLEEIWYLSYISHAFDLGNITLVTLTCTRYDNSH